MSKASYQRRVALRRKLEEEATRLIYGPPRKFSDPWEESPTANMPNPHEEGSVGYKIFEHVRSQYFLYSGLDRDMRSFYNCL